MKTFELLDIATADMAFAAYGATKEEMFANAAKALASVMFEGTVKPTQKVKIEASGADDVTRLQQFLAEILYVFETEHLILSEFKVKLDKDKVECEAAGEKYDAKRHKFIIDIKAVTYHLMEVKREGKGWKCVVVVDV